MSEIENFHAHVYYDAPTRAQALSLCEAAGERFGVKVGRMHDNPVGPHPRGSCQLTIGKEQFTDVVSWLVLNRRGLAVKNAVSNSLGFGEMSISETSNR